MSAGGSGVGGVGEGAPLPKVSLPTAALPAQEMVQRVSGLVAKGAWAKMGLGLPTWLLRGI